MIRLKIQNAQARGNPRLLDARPRANLRRSNRRDFVGNMTKKGGRREEKNRNEQREREREREDAKRILEQAELFRTPLTDHVEAVVQRHLRLGADLALVNPGVPFLGRLDLQRPVLRLVRMDHLEPQVRGVHQDTGAQYMHVPLTHPGHLQDKQEPGERVSR